MITVSFGHDRNKNANTFRGIGMYSTQLQHALSKMPNVSVSENNPDLVHYPFFDLFFHTLPLQKKKPTVVTIHDVIPFVYPNAYPVGIRGYISHIFQRLSLNSVKMILTDSECSKRDIQKYLHVPKEKIVVTYLAGNPELQKIQDDSQLKEIQEKYYLPSTYILYVGDMNYNKNLLSLLGSVALLSKEVHAVLVGRSLMNTSIPEGRVLHEEIQRLHLENRVHILSNIPHAPASILSSIYSMASCYVQPSLYEGFGLSVLDAMQCEVPVVSTSGGSLPEVGGDAVVYADSPSADDLARAIQTVFDFTPTQKQRLIEQGKQNLKRFSWEKCALETLEVYKSCLE